MPIRRGLKRYPEKRISKKRSYRRRRGYRSKTRTGREMMFLKTPGSIVADNYFATLNANDAAQLGQTGPNAPTGPTGANPSMISYIGNAPINVDIWRALINSGDPAAASIDANGVDQLSLLYTNVRVHGSKIKVQFLNTGSDVFRVAVFPYTNGNPLLTDNLYDTPGSNIPSMNDIIEMPYSKNSILTGKDGTGKTTIINYIGTKRIWGYKDISLGQVFSADFQPAATSTISPEYAFYWCIAVQSMTNQRTQQEVFCDVKIQYFSEMYGRQMLFNSNE